MYKRKFLISSLTGLFVVLMVSVTVFAATLVVTPSNMQGWSEFNFDDATSIDSSATTTSGTESLLVNGPAVPPSGTGSLKQIVGTNGDDATRVRRSDLNGTLLTALMDLSYSTYVTDNNGGQASYMQLRIDKDGNGTTDDTLFFEPVYQTGGYLMLSYSPGAVPNQCPAIPNCVALDAWQTWDADAGGWWSNKDSAGGPPLTTLANYAVQYPGAKLAMDSDALRITAGFGGGAWVNFVGYVDNVVLNDNNYNFELSEVSPSPSPSPTPTPNPFAVPAECSAITGLGTPIVGTSGSDNINGTGGNDLIFALGGSDRVNGKGGNDCIVGGDGSDRLTGANGDDVILGGLGSDSIDGGNQDDDLFGQEGSDSIRGGSGLDMLSGGDASDSLRGEGGADTLDGGLGSDSANGGGGTNTCTAESETSCEL